MIRLSEWTGRQIAMLWLIGIVGQTALTVVPRMALYAYMRREVPRLSHELALADSRWRAAERSDSLLVVAQRDDAIRSGRFSVTPTGDTVIGLVRAPSGRPAAVDGSIPFPWSTTFLVSLFVQHGTIPLALILITAYWIGVRGSRKDTIPGAA